MNLLEKGNFLMYMVAQEMVKACFGKEAAAARSLDKALVHRVKLSRKGRTSMPAFHLLSSKTLSCGL